LSVGTGRIARDIAFTLEKKSEKIFENIFLQNGVLALMGVNSRVKVVQGGNRFDERVHLGQNSTVDHRSKYTAIPTDLQDNFLTASYGQATISGASVVNMVEADQNMGKHRIDDLASALVEEAQLTFPNKIGSALMAASPDATQPESIHQRIEATAQGSQTSSLGGISRADHKGVADPTDMWQNYYSSSAISDIGAAAGIAAFSKFLFKCSPGGTAKTEQPDIVLTTIGVFSKAHGGADANRRYNATEKLTVFGFDNIKFNNAAMLADRNVPAGYAYALNTNYMRIQVLGGRSTKVVGDVKTVGDGKQSIALQVRPPIESDNSLHYAIKMYMVYNLTFGGLRQHGLQVSITEA